MIYNWDIIARLDATTSGNQHYLLVIDGSARDAQLIAKKLSGYVQEPTPAEAPFSYAFELPLNADETTLEKIRTAVREAIDQIHKINQFAPGATLGSPLFNGQAPTQPFFDLSQATFTATGTFFSDVEETERLAPPTSPTFWSTNTATSKEKSTAANPAPGLNISDKDMLIKDMEDTLLGKLPGEELLSENTKFEVFKNIDQNSPISSQQRAQKLDALADKKEINLDDSLNDFEHKLEDQSSDLEELQTVTNTITEKDLGFIKHAATNPKLPTVNSPQEQPQTPVVLPEEVALGNTIPPFKPSDEQKDDTDLPEITVRGQKLDALEKTFNLETTLSTEVMRTQYEKSIHALRTAHEKSIAGKNTSKPIVHPAQMMLQGETTKQQTQPSASKTQTGDSTMEEHPAEKTLFRIRRKQQKAPQVPHAPHAPSAPSAPAQAAPTPAASHPVTPEPHVDEPPTSTLPSITKDMNTVAAPIQQPAEKTIDHSIELPVSELKKHNWPLEVPLMPTYTLDNLVLSVNRFAHATAISVIENPGKMYNPLVFHGTTGTGKTHFLNAMAYGFSKKYGQENVFMTNGVRFSRGIQRYVMEHNIEKFEKFMQSVKVLLIDDIHLLAINEQNRAYISKILHTFLKEQKQIVITSKYPPESLEKLEDLINFRLDSGWISELKSPTGNTHFRIVKTMLLNNGVDLNDAQITQFFGNTHMTLSTIVRNIRRLRVLENLVFPSMPESERSQANMFEKLLATNGEDPTSELLTRDPDNISSIVVPNGNEWGRIGFFYPSHNSESMNWMVYALQQRARELGIPGGFEIAVRSSYSTENIISSAFKIANLCDNKKLRGAVILGPSLKVCEPSVRENFYDILTHMLEIMLIRCGIINAEALRLPSTYVKVISELLR